jgi:pimeloyl-ACP methyl ester carboxylesterase
VIPLLLLAEAGLRVIVPYLRGYGPTRFLDPFTPRSGQQAALGADVIDLMDALDIPRASLADYDWGWPRCLRGRGTVARALRGPGVRQQLPHPRHQHHYQLSW